MKADRGQPLADSDGDGRAEASSAASRSTGAEAAGDDTVPASRTAI